MKISITDNACLLNKNKVLKEFHINKRILHSYENFDNYAKYISL